MIKDNLLKKNESIEINIDDISVDGAGIGRYKGQIVFIQKALPGEFVRAKIIKAKKNYAIGLLLDILECSEDRTEPFCPVFGKCGGCTLQHFSYEKQLEFKANHIKQCFKRIGGIEIDTPKVIPSENKEEYRNKASFPVADINGRIQAGFYAHHSHRVVPSDCTIQQAVINDIKNIVVDWANKNEIGAYDEKVGKGRLRHIVARQASNGDIMAGIVATKPIADNELIDKLKNVRGVVSIVQNINSKNTNAILGNETQTLLGSEFITEQYEDLKFRASLQSFLQINHDQTQKLYEAVINYADIKKTDTVFDLFCGIGTITLLAAKRAKAVLGIEYVQTAVDNAEENAELNDINNAYFFAGDAGEMLDKGTEQLGNPDIVILDPPRKGCDASLLGKLLTLNPMKIVYVSCNPSTLARDVALLKDSYKLKDIVGVDMFPHTTHVECCSLLVRE